MIVAVRRMTVVCALFALLSLLAGGATAVSTSSATLYVDRANPSCSNSGAGSQAQPFCTISASVPQATPGTTVQVAAGTYAEQVSPHTGASGIAGRLHRCPGSDGDRDRQELRLLPLQPLLGDHQRLHRHRHDQPGHLRDRRART